MKCNICNSELVKTRITPLVVDGRSRNVTTYECDKCAKDNSLDVYHCIPVEEVDTHQMDYDCWCHPTRSTEEGELVVMHYPLIEVGTTERLM